MTVLVCSAPGKLAVEGRPLPVCGPGDALVRPKRVGICGTDYHIYEGKHPFLEYPRVMGHELAVELVSAPPGSDFEPGEICTVNPYLSCGACRTCKVGRPNCCERISVLGVHCDGGMAELLAVPLANLVKADGLSPDQCASVEFLAIGAHAVRRAAPRPGERTLVVGAGPIGLGVALFARLAGCEVALADLDTARAERVAEIAGASASASPTREDFDHVFDATGSQAAMQASFELVAPGGTLTLVGVLKASISFSDPDFHRKEMRLLASRNATTEDFDRVIAAIRTGEADISRVITHRTRLHDAPDDIAQWAADKAGLIKAVVELD
ncbi:zinc-binding alcohol dehydrogenase family protein [Sulfitobacter sp. LCG007]